MTAPKLPRHLLAGGSSVAITERPLAAGVVAHKPSSQQRPAANPWRAGQKETVYLAACEAATDADNAVDAYLVSIAWADHQGAVACTARQCFPQAVNA
jgi:hypothetical protein